MEANILVGQFGRVERRALPEPVGTVEKPVAQFGPVAIVKPSGKNFGIATEVHVVIGEGEKNGNKISYPVLGYLCTTDKGMIYVKLAKPHMIVFTA